MPTAGKLATAEGGTVKANDGGEEREVVQEQGRHQGEGDGNAAVQQRRHVAVQRQEQLRHRDAGVVAEEGSVSIKCRVCACLS